MAPIPKSFGLGFFISYGGPSPCDPAWMHKFSVIVHFWKWHKYFPIGRGPGNWKAMERPRDPGKPRIRDSDPRACETLFAVTTACSRGTIGCLRDHDGTAKKLTNL